MKYFIAIVIIFVIAGLIIIAYVNFNRFRKKLNPKLIEQIQTEWKKLIRENNPRHAILEADKLLDHALTQLGYTGSLGTKLKNHPKLFRKINDVWAAHKVRNNIAHKLNYEVDEKTYKKTMLQFKQAFKDLNIF